VRINSPLVEMIDQSRASNKTYGKEEVWEDYDEFSD